MDEVVIATSNPVKGVAGIKPSSKHEKSPGTFLNFILMMPLALIILIQAFYFGMSVGNYSTFPVYTIQSYLTLGSLLTLIILMQMIMRSIVYSTVFSFMLVAGILHAWFGDFLTPVSSNFKEIIAIMKSAWSNKDIPYPILMASIITAILGVTVFVNFFISLFTKYLFEVVFGRDWGDGHFTAFITAIIFMLITHFCLYFYSNSVAESERILWVQKSLYSPIEEFCSRIPSAGIFNHDRVWMYDSKGITALNSLNGQLISEKMFGAEILAPYWSAVSRPVVPTKKSLKAYERDLASEIWTCPFNKELASFTPPENESREGLSIPLLIRTDVSEDYIFAMFDFGFWGAISASDGKMLWVKGVDAPTRINRLFLEDYLRNPFICAVKDTVIFSCSGARLVALSAKTGQPLWEYVNPETKVAGKPQKAFLTVNEGKVLATFPSGQLVLFDALKGTKLAQASSVQWKPVTPAYLDKGYASFVSDEGNILKVELDGGKVIISKMIFQSRPILIPIPLNLSKGFIAFKDAIYKVSMEDHEVKEFFSFSKHIFATNPLVDDDFVYAGSQDGWLFCFHKESLKEKWRMRLNGELMEESLRSSEFGILVRTRSGTIYCIKKGFN
ncbi:MAG: PQQ-binding-like beta-propeller repeat protein [Candidatus Riflebacteria bacterium]|nr:PQQ-binding-like beta-propeller repeat protein [Candidatus Riflebacteria bacterium]